MLTYEKFVNIIDALEDARVLLAALEFDVFTILDKKEMTVRQIARKAEAQDEGMSALLHALVALGALKKTKNGKFANTPEMYKHFCRSSPDYKKGTAHLKMEKNDEWNQLIQTIRKGRDLTAFEDGDDPEFRHCFSYAMHERSEPYASRIAALLAKKKSIGKFLDLGGGPGSYCAAVLRQDKKAEATLLDRDAACNVARALFGKEKFFSRFTMKPGDLFETDYGNGFDTVLFSNILHIYNPAENRKLLKKIHKALKPGGRLAVVDFFLNEDRTAPYEAAMFSLTMLLFTETGKTYTFSETEHLLTKAGFHKFQTHKLDEGSHVIVATRK
ncbi:putative O-methyltransferase, family 2 [Nitrospina gracilis 3/211]|uniref:Putative O-methyltransferase, family 2 n=1 Tax=Nitrospina gracilis (strain 3/211) TaxID=1266370 RepID=M1Z236_NITG3|nr:methyltransferase [Nitrospina gracilis]MCF8724405.1 ubiquinone/menaquinone biosynthesis C-methylase UbiE [Nitrospina sp. Nb-3]CCQ91561.1 putative O-methyltransferase, family 2 [Nitrospina gracilis 3/211]